MTTDIHSLDRYIGQCVSLQEGEEGLSGFVVDVEDEVKYQPRPTRYIVVDYGYGFPVTADTEITVLPESPTGEVAPDAPNPIRVMHQAAHAGEESQCADEALCPHFAAAMRGLRAFRVWRMKRSDKYWEYEYVRWARTLTGDPSTLQEILRDARKDGAPARILDTLKALADQAGKEVQT